MAEVKHICPVCGYGMDLPASDYNICQCCGVEFGYEDAGTTHEELRSRWIARGAPWLCEELRPEGWSLTAQLMTGGG